MLSCAGVEPRVDQRVERSTNGGVVTANRAERPRTSRSTSSPSVSPAGSTQRERDAHLERRRERAARDLAEHAALDGATVMCGRGIPRSSDTRPDERRSGPAAFSATRASRPRKAGFAQPTAQPAGPAPGGSRGERSWPCSG